jgi:signal transduction histidine kinase
LPPEIWPRFGVLPSDRLVFYRQPALVRAWRTRASIAAGDSDGGARVNVAACEMLAVTLDASAFVSAPVLQHGKSTGRLYLLSTLPRTFTRSEAAFLSLALEHILPVIEHLQLLEKLASDAARDERRRIALDLHDAVLQPFIGLRLGLTALSEKLAAGNQGIAADVRRLLEMSSDGIEQLRDNVLALRKTTVRGETLLPAIRRVAERFSALTGIDVEVSENGAIQVSDRVAGETLQMIAEGLSNVRRHTAATRARVGVTSDAGRFVVRIENDGSERDSFASFQPRSIGERASALGGDVRVERRAGGGAIVEIEVPVA